VTEPDFITRATLFADRHFGKGDLNNGWYVDFANMIPGAGWLSAGPGYRKWFAQDRFFVDGSAAYSWHGYKTAQARFEMPKIARSRLAIGSQIKWHDYGHVDYFGQGPDTPDIETEYGIRATEATGHATFRPVSWLAVGGQIGWLTADTRPVEGLPLPAGPAERTFVPIEGSITADTRDFPDHPTSGTLLRGAIARYDDRDGGAFTFDRYEGEAAGFIPVSGGRVVVALHGWLVGTETEDGRSVPYYLLPSLGGRNTLRSYSEYRFHDRHLLTMTAEVRFALLTHLEAAAFVDAGNVAARVQDLDLGKRSYGAGLRLHTRRATFARFDVAHGGEGWQFLFRLTDPLRLSRLRQRADSVPFVP
jgi:hypothetical protein